MTLPIRQNATHKVVIGPVVVVGDGFTPVTTLSLASADEAEVILHDDGTVVDISGYTFAAIATADGYYHLTLQTGISGTVGHMSVVINDDSLCLPVKENFTVMEEAAYDDRYAAGAVSLATAAALTTVDGVVDGIQTDLDNGTDGLGAIKAAVDTVNTDLGNATDGLGAIKTAVDALQTDLDNGTDGLGALKVLIDAVKAETALIVADTNELQTDDLPATLLVITKLLRNKSITDPVTGVMTVYEDDNVTPFFTANIFENAGGTQAYQGQGIDRKERFI